MSTKLKCCVLTSWLSMQCQAFSRDLLDQKSVPAFGHIMLLYLLDWTNTDVIFLLHTIKLSHVMSRPAFCIYAKTKVQISYAEAAQLISAFVFTTKIVQFLYFQNPNFKPPAICGFTAQFVSDRVRNSVDRFSNGTAQSTCFVTLL